MATLIDLSNFHIFSYVSGGILLAYSLSAVINTSGGFTTVKVSKGLWNGHGPGSRH